MKTGNQLSIIILVAGLLVSGIVYGDDPVKGSGTDSTTGSGTGMGWQEQTRRTSVFYSDGLNLSTGVGINVTGLNWTFGVSSSFSNIECCQPTTMKQSWCNFNADDPRCPD